jgi:hypothetical protein
VKSKNSQAGVSLFGAIIVLGFLAVCFLIAAKTIPSIVEWRATVKLIQKVAAEAHSVDAARDGFDRQAYVSDISTISGKDLDITRDGDGVVIDFAYEKKIPLAGPVSLAIDYAGHSNKGS